MQERSGEHPRGDAGQLALLVIFLAVWAVDSFALRFSTVLALYAPLAVRLGAAALLLIGAVLLVRSGHAAVGHGREPAGVIRTGTFRFLRHPLYLGCILFSLALAVATASLLSLLVLAVIYRFYDFIAGYEERLLEKRFGEEYRAYRAVTGKWLPCFGRRERPVRTR